MVVSFHDISDKQVIKYIETCLQDKEKIKEVKKSVQKMKNIQEKKTNELKKIIKKSLKKIIKKSLKKSIRKSLKKTNTDKLITDIIKRLENNIEDLSISDLVKKKLRIK